MELDIMSERMGLICMVANNVIISVDFVYSSQSGGASNQSQGAPGKLLKSFNHNWLLDRNLLCS